MIKKISLKNVASYKDEAILETDKFINLIYGLNGAGKTQLSKYLQNKDNDNFKDCRIEGLGDEKILVYNQDFIYNNFYEKSSQKGIFMLGEENTQISKNIENSEKKLEELKDKRSKIENNKKEFEKKEKEENENLKNKIWKIIENHKSDFDFCLEGYKKKEKLFNHLLKLEIKNSPNKTLDELKKEAEIIKDDNKSEISHIKFPRFDDILQIEENHIFKEVIIGNKDSVISELIQKLDNSDWVKEGRKYIQENSEECPFCQSQTITKEFKSNLEKYFDENYNTKLNEIVNLQNKYKEFYENIPNKDSFYREEILDLNNKEFELLYNKLKSNIESNQIKITEKIKQPNNTIELKSSKQFVNNLDNFLQEIQRQIESFNKKLKKKKELKQDIENFFWKNMYLNYKQDIESFKKEQKRLKAKIDKCQQELNECDEEINKQKENLQKEQRNIINTQKAKDNINSYLEGLGITNFKIEDSQENNSYAIKRPENNEPTFKTLSEGEKTLITFLYFLQSCQGEENSNEVGQKEKIIVIDDPISSLSYNYVFDIAQLIKHTFLKNNNTKYKQIFILTHHLYFFHELLGHKEDYEGKVKAFRIYKGEKYQSCIKTISKREIMNEYQTYWEILKDCKENPTNNIIIPNTMRNILEYFLGFIKKDKIDTIKDLNNEENDTRYKAFYNYINRESHSFMKNIIDFKDIEIDIFFKVFEKIFEKLGYKEHYEIMMK